MTNGNSNCFSDPTDSPFALQLPAIKAVQGDCERVYSGQPWEAVTQLNRYHEEFFPEVSLPHKLN